MSRRQRQPHEIANINLRIRESLRRKLEREAKRHRFSLNTEIRLRLEDTLQRQAPRELELIAADIELHWARYADRHLALELEDQLIARLAEVAESKDPELASLARVCLDKRWRRRNTGVRPGNGEVS
jgi:hypothetical protein